MLRVRECYTLIKSADRGTGACGEIVALKGKYYRNLFNPLVAAQNFEVRQLRLTGLI